MNIYTYTTDGGKDLIYEYLNALPKKQSSKGHTIIVKLQAEGIAALHKMDTKQLKNKLREIRFGSNRLMYVLVNDNEMYILHACKKQKGKAEKFELDKGIERAKELGRELGKDFV